MYRHHLIVFGKAPRLDYLRARWDKLVSIVDASTAHFDAIEAGVPDGGAILVSAGRIHRIPGCPSRRDHDGRP